MTVVVGLDSSFSPFTVCKRYASVVEPTFHGLCNCECTFSLGRWRALETLNCDRYEHDMVHELFHSKV